MIRSVADKDYKNSKILIVKYKIEAEKKWRCHKGECISTFDA